MAAAKAIREKSVEDHLMGRCLELDIFVLKNTGMKGIPDRLLIWDKTHWFLELKRPGKEPTALQRAVARKLRDHGAVAVWADSKEQVDRILDAMVSRMPAPRDRIIAG